MVDLIVLFIGDHAVRVWTIEKDLGSEIGQRVVKHTSVPMFIDLGCRNADQNQVKLLIHGEGQVPPLDFPLDQILPRRKRGGQDIAPEAFLHQILVTQPG
ncbi:hypothetical protein D3C81_1509000 [compost metagenome]